MHPLLIALAAAALVLVAAFVPSLWRVLVPQAPAPVVGAPWQVALRADKGIEVFGLRLPGSTLADVRRRWPEGLRIAILSGRGEADALEAYVDQYVAGGIDGRLVLSFEAPAVALAQWRLRSEGARVDGQLRRYDLGPAVLDEAAGAALAGITFMPAASLSPEVVTQRFGAAAERLRVGAAHDHWLYPATGTAIVIDAQGKDLIQYVAPADFERRLRAPLRAN